MRKSVADIARRVEICRAANERYLEALGVVGEPSPTRHLLDPVSKRINRQGRCYRALRPIDPEEAKLFSLLQDGAFLLQGFRNKDLRARDPTAATASCSSSDPKSLPNLLLPHHHPRKCGDGHRPQATRNRRSGPRYLKSLLSKQAFTRL